MSLKFMDSVSTAQHKQLLVSSAISLYSVMYEEYMCEKMMKIRQSIRPLRRFYYRHHAIRGAGVCIYPDVPIFILYWS